MSELRAVKNEPAHVACIRAVVTAIAAGLFAAQITGTAGIVAAVVAAIVAVPLARIVAVSRLRLPLVVAGSLAVIGLGVASESLIAGTSWSARILGPTRSITISQVVAIGSILLGTLVVLRVLATRHPLFGLLEVLVPALLIVAIFAGHRGLHLQHPRFFSDWALTHGYDPIKLLFAIGAVTFGVLCILLLQTTTKTKSFAALLILAMLSGGVFLGLRGCEGDSDKDRKKNQGAQQEPSPGDDSNSPTPVAEVWLHDDVDAFDGGLYFRSGARSQYNQRMIEESRTAGMDADIPAEFPKQPLSLRLDKVNPAFFHEVKSKVGLLVDLKRPLAFVLAQTLTPEENPNPAHFRAVYTVSSLNLPEKYESLIMLPMGNPSWSPEMQQYYLAAPKDPRYADLVKKLETGLDETGRRSPLLRALATRRWLGKVITYSLHVTHADKDTQPDPIGKFLFETRKGSCVHIAHAFVYLLRTQGIPARIGTGFMVPESRRKKSSHFMIIGTDAHAWTEIFLAGIGWVIIDVACERTEEPPPPEPDKVTDDVLKKELQKLPPDLVEHPEEESVSFVWLWSILPGAFAMLYLVKAWRRLAPSICSERSLYRIAYRATLDRLAEVRFIRRFGETREEFAHRVEEIAPEFVMMSHAHMRRAVGERESMDARAWRESLRRATAQIRERVPGWRRFLGVLNPVSWMLVQ